MESPKRLSLARKIQFTLIIVFSSLLIIFGAGEIFVRTTHILLRPPYDSKEPDDLLGWKTKDFYRYKTSSFKNNKGGKYAVNLSFSRHGFREWNQCKSDSPKATIFFVGDSYTESVESSDDSVFHAVIGDKLNIKVFAVGTAGYGTTQEFMVLSRYIDSVKPDAVVLEVCNNDFMDNYWPLEKRANYKVGKRRPYLNLQQHIEYHNAAGWIETSKEYSLLVNFILLRTENLLIAVKLKGPKEDISAIMMDTVNGGRQLYQESCALTANALQQIKMLTDSRGVRLFIFDADDFQPGTSWYPETCHKLGIEMISGVADEIKRRDDIGECTHASDNYHWNHNGQKVVAGKLIEYFSAHNLPGQN